MLDEIVDCHGLTRKERAENYRAFAACAEQWAHEAATDELCTGYLMLAEQWRKLAREIEAEANRITITLDDAQLALLLRAPTSG